MNKCPSCSNSVSQNAKFCGKCGFQLKCSNCEAPILAGNSFCENCGTEVIKKGNTSSPNKIKFHENSEGRSFEAEFSDEVGKDITGSLGDLLTARQLALSNGDSKEFDNSNFQPIKQSQEKDENIEDVSFEETKEITPKLNTTSYPSLQSVVIKNRPANEAEWIVVYSFYASSFGKNIFTRQDIIDLYAETNRKTESRMKNLTPYINSVIRADSINPINNNGDFSILDKGIERAIEIVNRTSSSPNKSLKSKPNSKPTKTEGRNARKTSSTKKGFSVLDLGLDESKRQDLRSFFTEKSPKSQEDIVLVLGYWLQNNAKLSGFGTDEIYTAIQIVSAKTPSALGQVLINIKNAGKSTKDKTSKLYNLNHIGEDYVKFELPKGS